MNSEEKNEFRLTLTYREYMDAKRSLEVPSIKLFSSFLREIGISVSRVARENADDDYWNLIFKSGEEKTQFMMKHL